MREATAVWLRMCWARHNRWLTWLLVDRGRGGGGWGGSGGRWDGLWLGHSGMAEGGRTDSICYEEVMGVNKDILVRK